MIVPNDKKMEPIARWCRAFSKDADEAFGRANKGVQGDNPMLLAYVTGALGLASVKENEKWHGHDGGAHAAEPGHDMHFHPEAAFAVLITALLENLPEAGKVRFPVSVFDDALAGAIELYTARSGPLSSHQYELLRRRQEWKPGIPEISYGVLRERLDRKGYPRARAAYKALLAHDRAVDALAGSMYLFGWDLRDALYSMDAPDALYVLSGKSVDLRYSWEGDEADHVLAELLFDAEAQIFADAVRKYGEGELRGPEHRNTEKLFTGNAKSVDDVAQAAEELMVGVKLGFFLDGIPMEDILA